MGRHGKIDLNILFTNTFSQSRFFFAVLMRTNKQGFWFRSLLNYANEHYIPEPNLVSFRGPSINCASLIIYASWQPWHLSRTSSKNGYQHVSTDIKNERFNHTNSLWKRTILGKKWQRTHKNNGLTHTLDKNSNFRNTNIVGVDFNSLPAWLADNTVRKCLALLRLVKKS